MRTIEKTKVLREMRNECSEQFTFQYRVRLAWRFENGVVQPYRIDYEPLTKEQRTFITQFTNGFYRGARALAALGDLTWSEPVAAVE